MHCAGHRAHAAEHHHGEGDQDIGLADARVHIIARQQHAGGDGEAGRADAESHGVDMCATSMPTSAAPSCSLATARIALPVSVFVSSAQSTSATRHATPNAITLGSRQEQEPRSIVEKP